MSEHITIVGKLVGKDRLEITLNFLKSEFIGKKSTLELRVESECHIGDPLTVSRILSTEEFTVESPIMMHIISLTGMSYSTYRNEKGIDILFYATCTIDDGIFFDTNTETELEIIRYRRNPPSGTSNQIMYPKESLDIIENIKSLPDNIRNHTIIVTFITLSLAVGNIFIGYHDRISPMSRDWIYSSYEIQSPFILACMISSLFLGGLGYYIYRQLGRYLTISWRDQNFSSEKWITHRLSDHITGMTPIDLHDLTVRIVAGNREGGEYMSGGKKRQVHTFSLNSHAAILSEKTYDFIPKNTPLEMILTQTWSFDIMYKTLYPEMMVQEKYGVQLDWKVQFLHPRFRDKEIIGTKSFYQHQNFVE